MRWVSSAILSLWVFCFGLVALSHLLIGLLGLPTAENISRSPSYSCYAHDSQINHVPGTSAIWKEAAT